MNEETIIFRLDQIEKKLDTLINLQVQTEKQEVRLTAVETEIKELKTIKNKSVDRWLTPLISACVSGLIAFIFVKIGLH